MLNKLKIKYLAIIIILIGFCIGFFNISWPSLKLSNHKVIEKGSFREDLYYRLNVFPIESPSLAQRAEDIPLLLKELMRRVNEQSGTTAKFTERAIDSLKEHSWPGNIRELANLVERMVIMFPDKVVDVPDLPNKYRYIEVEAYEPQYPEELMERYFGCRT